MCSAVIAADTEEDRDHKIIGERGAFFSSVPNIEKTSVEANQGELMEDEKNNDHKDTIDLDERLQETLEIEKGRPNLLRGSVPTRESALALVDQVRNNAVSDYNSMTAIKQQ